MTLVLLPKALGVRTYHLQNLGSLEPFRLLLFGRVIVHMAALISTRDILFARSAQFVQQV